MRQIRRRQFLLCAVTLLATPAVAIAQQSAKARRIGFLGLRSRSTPSNPDVFYEAFIRGMRELGYVEGDNLIIEWRFADSKYERLSTLATELANANVEVIVTHATPPTRALQRATKTVPVVFISVNDPVRNSIVASLARPGGNITGVANVTNDIDTKLVEELKNLLPALSRAAVLVDPDNPAVITNLKNIQIAANRLGVTILPVDAHTAGEIEGAFATMMRERVEGVIVPLNALFFGQRFRIAQLATQSRLPLINQSGEETSAGGLLSYGPNSPAIYRRAAVYVDKILKGAKPSELPIEQPTTFELAVNLKTAKALGLTIPQSVLLRADRVIE